MQNTKKKLSLRVAMSLKSYCCSNQKISYRNEVTRLLLLLHQPARESEAFSTAIGEKGKKLSLAEKVTNGAAGGGVHEMGTAAAAARKW